MLQPPKPANPFAILSGLVGLVIFVLGMLLLFNPQFLNQMIGGMSGTSATSTRSTSARPVKRDPSLDFQITSWDWHKDPNFAGNGAVVWTAEVKNKTSEYVEYVKVEFTTYDSSGRVVDTDFVYATGLSPYGTGSVKSYATYFGTETQAKIRIAGR